MSETTWEVVYETNGAFLAEILKGLLEAQGIATILSQEGAGRAYGLTVGTLGRAEILVPASDVERALQILQDYETNNLASAPDADAELFDQLDLDEDQPETGETI